MSDLISRQAAIDAIRTKYCSSDFMDDGVIDAFAEIIQDLPSAQPDRGYIEQVKWERDTAIAQLKELGYGLGEKIRTDTDTISRQAAIDAIRKDMYADTDYISALICDGIEEVLNALPSTQPEIIRCKDCKHYEIWQLKSDYTDDKRFKPSVCVIGCYAVHRPEDWYCADAERRTDETD